MLIFNCSPLDRKKDEENYICLRKDIIEENEDLSMPRSSLLYASVIFNGSRKNWSFHSFKKTIHFFLFTFLFRTVQHYGKIYHQKQTKCIFNSSKSNQILFYQPWKFVVNSRRRRRRIPWCIRHPLYLPDPINRKSSWQEMLL